MPPTDRQTETNSTFFSSASSNIMLRTETFINHHRQASCPQEKGKVILLKRSEELKAKNARKKLVMSRRHNGKDQLYLTKSNRCPCPRNTKVQHLILLILSAFQRCSDTIENSHTSPPK